MATHLYMSLVPEALIASMLSPEEFGAYYAVGAMKKARGQALFIELDPAFHDRFFPIGEALKRCVPHENGDPKRSLYLSVYRVAENIPVSALGSLYLTTCDGRVAELKKEECPSDVSDGLHLYQELCPTRPLVASTKGPVQFYQAMTDKKEQLFALPALYFADLKLGDLATDPEFGDGGELPYGNLDHLRQCLVDVRTKRSASKIVDRNHSVVFPYRVVRTGFYFGQGKNLAFYPMPSKEALLHQYYAWWRSAQM